MPILTDQKQAAPARPLRKWIMLGVAAVCLLLIVVVAKRVRAGDAHSDEAASGAEAGAVYAAVAPVQAETIANSLSIAGQFMPYQNVELHAKVAGYIRHIYVDIGDHVRAGETLAVLEIPELVAQVDASKAEVHHAEEEIQRSKSEVSRAQADNVALHANAAGWSIPTRRARA